MSRFDNFSDERMKRYGLHYYEVIVPEHCLPYIINGDTEGYTDEEISKMDKFVNRWNGKLAHDLSVDAFCVPNEDASPSFYAKNDVYGWIGCDCYRFALITKSFEQVRIGYKLFYRNADGDLFPPMVANPKGKPTPIDEFLMAKEPEIACYKNGRPMVKCGGKGTRSRKGLLAYRPGWHLGKLPYALQFNKGEYVDNPLGIRGKNGKKILVRRYFPKDLVWAEVEYNATNCYNKEAESYGMNKNGKFVHALASLPHLPYDGYYTYRTNPNPATDEWIITDSMRIIRVLTEEEVDKIVLAAGRCPQEREV